MVIDISHHNGIINWDELLLHDEKITKVIHKASEGTSPDPMMVKNCENAVKHGLKISAYQFATWNNSDEVADAKSEAKTFISRIKLLPPITDTLWLDTETNEKHIRLSPPEVQTFILVFMEEMAQAGFPDVGQYSSPGFINSFLPVKHKIGNLKLWQADYRKVPVLPNRFQKWDLLQYTDKGKVRGIDGFVDLNREAVPK